MRLIVFENHGSEIHEAMLVKLAPGTSATESMRWAARSTAMISSESQWLRRDFGPGRYVLHCEMPLTTDAQSAKQEITHADLGMVREVEIK